MENLLSAWPQPFASALLYTPFFQRNAERDSSTGAAKDFAFNSIGWGFAFNGARRRFSFNSVGWEFSFDGAGWEVSFGNTRWALFFDGVRWQFSLGNQPENAASNASTPIVEVCPPQAVSPHPIENVSPLANPRPMPLLNLKPTHKSIQRYYETIAQLAQAGAHHEGAVAPAFAQVLEYCARQYPDLQLIEQYPLPRQGRRPIRVDGALIDRFHLRWGVWEAKDVDDDLPREVSKKFAEGYPKDNILFQSPQRIMLFQNGHQVLDKDIRQPEALIEGLRCFFEYQPPAYTEWQGAVAGFKEKVQEVGAALLKIMVEQREKNPAFINAFQDFFALCQQAINPNLSEPAVEEMLVQHVLTERIFRKVFNHPDFMRKNAIACEIEKVIAALTVHAFSREEFLQCLDHCYRAIEVTAATIEDFSEKQGFLNAVYEQFFQGFAVDVADTHGIVYTPQPLVEFMVRSVEALLQKHFDRSLSDQGVHMLDPFVGTGNFILRVLKTIDPAHLARKYRHELHCNEVLLLPYYIASLNIEHAYFEATQRYEPFNGLCLVDTFELAEAQQGRFLFTTENTARVDQQKKSPIFVIMGNPPYNAGQANENDNNKNRKYPVVDGWVSEGYARSSRATNKNALSDPYVKAFAWATERLRGQSEGMVAFVSNNSFLDSIAFDGMRKALAEGFSAIYLLDLGGNIRKNPKLSGTTHNVFGIQVGVCITLLVKKPTGNLPGHIFYARMDEMWKKAEKFAFLDEKKHVLGVNWQEITPDPQHTWLTEGLRLEFDGFIPLGTKEQKAKKQEVAEGVLFQRFSCGVSTSRDAWVYNFNPIVLENNVRKTIANYNDHVTRWQHSDKTEAIDDFVTYADQQLSWSRDLKRDLQRMRRAEYKKDKIRCAIYRPFTKTCLFLDRILNEEVYVFPSIFPNAAAEQENKVICCSGVGSSKPFQVLMVHHIPCLDILEKTQCFPFYTYEEDGTGRTENIPMWAVERFRTHYKSKKIDRWDIFYYIYGLLHHPEYRLQYAANLRRSLPKIPLAKDFWAFSKAGRTLAQLHVDYDQQPEYRLQRRYVQNTFHDWTVRKMRLSADRTTIVYNEWLSLSGVPEKVFDYRLGNRSALEWVLERYQITTDARSGITNDPNQPDNPQAIVRLIGQVVHVSVETVRIMEGLPALEM